MTCTYTVIMVTWLWCISCLVFSPNPSIYWDPNKHHRWEWESWCPIVLGHHLVPLQHVFDGWKMCCPLQRVGAWLVPPSTVLAFPSTRLIQRLSSLNFSSEFYNSSIYTWWLKHRMWLKVTNQWIIVIEVRKKTNNFECIVCTCKHPVMLKP